MFRRLLGSPSLCQPLGPRTPRIVPRRELSSVRLLKKGWNAACRISGAPESRSLTGPGPRGTDNKGLSCKGPCWRTRTKPSAAPERRSGLSGETQAFAGRLLVSGQILPNVDHVKHAELRGLLEAREPGTEKESLFLELDASSAHLQNIDPLSLLRKQPLEALAGWFPEVLRTRQHAPTCASFCMQLCHCPPEIP